MFRTILFALLAVAFYAPTKAQNAEYQSAMEEVVTEIQNSPFGTDLIPMANQMERIAAVERKEWLPNYWAAFCYMLKVYTEPVSEKKDLILDKADQLISRADSLQPNNDEIAVLQANLASARISIDPQNRWQKYGALSAMALAKAKTINPENPRAALLEAQTVFYTPESFGGGKQKAKPLLQAALDKFAAFKSTSTIMPNWGKEIAAYMMSEAEK